MPRIFIPSLLLLLIVMTATHLAVSARIEPFPIHLEIEPEYQTDRLPLGEKKSYRFSVHLEGNYGSIVEFLPPDLAPGWFCQFYDSANIAPLSDTDRDGCPELGVVQPDRPHHFTVRIEAPNELLGEPEKLDSTNIAITGFLDGEPLIRDTVRLIIKLIPELLIHNFPNPLEDRTTFVISLPDNGEVNLFIFNRAGERICTILQYEPLVAGIHQIGWNGCNDRNQPVAPGTYDYLLEWHRGDTVRRLKKKLVVNRR